MRAREVKQWLGALVDMAGADAFDAQVAAHIVRVLELVEGPQLQHVEGRSAYGSGAEGELARCTIKVLRARADAVEKARKERALDLVGLD